MMMRTWTTTETARKPRRNFMRGTDLPRFPQNC
jgi:hypothetical protein